MTTKQPDYDTKPGFGTLLQKHRTLPFKRFMDLISSKISDLDDMLNRPAAYDQYPGKIIPYAIPIMFGPLPLTTARRALAANGATGHELLATLAQPASFYVPRAGNILIDREFTFEARSMSAYGFVNWGYTANPGYTVPLINAQGVGDIMDRVIEDNGGAMPLDYFGGTFSTLSTPFPNAMNISFDLEFYDRQRGRRLHDHRIPVEMLQGGRLAHRTTGSPIRFDRGTRFEPRLFVNEIRMGSALDTTQAFNAASVKVWVCVVLKGRQLISVPGGDAHDRLR